MLTKQIRHRNNTVVKTEHRPGDLQRRLQYGLQAGEGYCVRGGELIYVECTP